MTSLSHNITQFNNKLKIFRQFQLDAFNSSKTSNIGQIFLPTGTGKTLIQLAIHVDDMINKPSGEYGVYVIAAHRLVLCNQLFNEFRNFVSGFNLPASYVYVGSDQQSNGTFEATTDTPKIKEIVDLSKNNEHVIIVATYHSFDHLSILDKIDVCTYDEVHTSVNEKFRSNIEAVKHKILRNYFFTATKKELDNGLGQNDEVFYGKILYDKMPPAEAIKQMEIVTPKIHQIKVESEDGPPIENNFSMLLKVITSSFVEHKKIITKSSHGKIGCKILINAQGLYQVHPFQLSKEFKSWCISNRIHCFSFSSTQGEYVNFLKETRQNALEKLQSLKDEDDALIFHYNIISEGIDLPNLTGVIILRNVDLIKFTQIVGRACRLLKSDRDKLYKGIIQNVNQLVKPECWVIIPEYKGVESDLLTNLTEFLRTTYEVPTVKYPVISKVDSEQTEINASSRKLEIGVDDQELEHILEIYTETIEFDLNQLFNISSKKEEFLKEILDEVYEEDDIIDLTEIIKVGKIKILEGKIEEHKFLTHKRNIRARNECIKRYGYECFVCRKTLEETYGGVGENQIEVHHLIPISETNEEYVVNINELIPVCPNCHTIIHTKCNPCYTPGEVREMIFRKQS